MMTSKKLSHLCLKDHVEHQRAREMEKTFMNDRKKHQLDNIYARVNQMKLDSSRIKHAKKIQDKLPSASKLHSISKDHITNLEES